MIIKLYTTDMAIHILEDVSDITIDNSLADFKKEYPTNRIYLAIECLGDEIDININRSTDCKTIMFTNKHGVEFYTQILNTAYICNNDGKTIEKVVV